MEFKNKMESWNVPPKSSLTFQRASVLFTPAHLCGEAGAQGGKVEIHGCGPYRKFKGLGPGWGQNHPPAVPCGLQVRALEPFFMENVNLFV